MPYIQRKRRGYVLWLKVRWAVIGLSAVGVLVAGFWALTRIGPRSIGGGTPGTTVPLADPEIGAMQAEVKALHERYQTGGEAADADLLREAVRLQQQVVAQWQGGGQAEVRRLLALEKELDAVQARELNAEIFAGDTRGRIAAEAMRLTEAEAAWRGAWEKQQTVNRSGAPASLKNFRREAEFEQKIQGLGAAPLAEEVAEALRVARSEVAAEHWAEAFAAYGAARTVQQQINSEFARSPFADRRKLDLIERELEALDAANLAREVDELEAQGDEEMAAEAFAAAAGLFERARQLQMEINRDFARSQFLSSVRVQDLDEKRQTAASIPLLRAIEAEDRAITDLLRRRQTVLAAQRIGAAESRLRTGVASLPRSQRWDAGLQLRLSYLASQRERLAEIQDAVYERLRPLPGVGELRILRTEFPQALYQQVMKTNPSRNPGREFPVDSVNWFEARACGQRLSWMLGRTVRLPRVDEFRIAVADTASGGIVGARQTSQAMASVEPNAGGLYDLRGNLAEWLAAAPSEDGGVPAPLGGGSYLDEVDQLTAVGYQEMPRGSRARHVGFRVVVEFDPTD